jgi:hypothetical protein
MIVGGEGGFGHVWGAIEVVKLKEISDESTDIVNEGLVLL